MIATRKSAAPRAAYRRGINRDQSPLLARGVPWLTIVLGSLTPLLPVISSAPVLPPLGLMLLLAWRLSRPGLLPPWAGLPLGFVDDLFSGQPLGSAIMLWSSILLAIEVMEVRFPWRGFLLDWLAASIIIAAYLLASAWLATGDATRSVVVVPQLLLSILIFPLLARLVAKLDRLRLSRIRLIA